MYFYKKSDFMDLDRKINSITEQLRSYDSRQDAIFSYLDNIENRLSLIESQLIDNNCVLSKRIQDLSINIFSQINSLNTYIDIIKSDTMNYSEEKHKELCIKIQLIIDEILHAKYDLLNAQKENMTPLMDSISPLSSTIHDAISKYNHMNIKEINILNNELKNKYDELQLLIRLLLLNSVMDQLEE